MMLSLCFCLVACDSTDSTDSPDSTEGGTVESQAYLDMQANITADESAKSEIAYTYVGSYETINSMGVVRAAHIINLFNDGSLEIYMGFFNDGMGGSLQEYYTGTYTLDNQTLKIEYFSAGNKEEDRSMEATVTDGSFAGKIWIGASYSTYDIVYYSIDIMSVANADEVFVGSTSNTESETYSAGAMSMYYGAEGSYPEDEGSFIYSVQTESFDGTISGTYSKEWAGLDADDMIEFLYSDCTDSVNYSNSYVLATAFTLDNNTNSNTLVRVK